MKFTIAFACAGVVSSGIFGCAGEDDSSPQCRARDVILDAGIDGLPDVGEDVSRERCQLLCGLNTYSCARAKETILTCQPACK